MIMVRVMFMVCLDGHHYDSNQIPWRFITLGFTSIDLHTTNITSEKHCNKLHSKQTDKKQPHSHCEKCLEHFIQLHCELNALMIFCTYKDKDKIKGSLVSWFKPKFCSQLYNNAIIQIDTIHTMFVNVLFIFRITTTTIKFNNRPSIKHLSIVLMFESNNFIITSLYSPVCCL